jgi:hypothetical protein
MAWTPEQDTELRSLWSAGHTVPEIAKRLKRNPSTIKARRKRLGLRPRRTGELSEKVRVGFHLDTMSLMRAKARRTGQTIPARIRMLVERDLREP